MLKLRKNQKGFTLVELIVVIAIMAVLAGTVAGITVSQLNKNTDKTNVTQRLNQLASAVVTEIADNGTGAFDNSSPAVGETPATAATAYDATKIATFLKNKSSGVEISGTQNTTKGEFFVLVIANTATGDDVDPLGTIYICYNGKTNNYKVAYISVTNGATGTLKYGSNESFPTAATGESNHFLTTKH